MIQPNNNKIHLSKEIQEDPILNSPNLSNLPLMDSSILDKAPNQSNSSNRLNNNLIKLMLLPFLILLQLLFKRMSHILKQSQKSHLNNSINNIINYLVQHKKNFQLIKNLHNLNKRSKKN